MSVDVVRLDGAVVVRVAGELDEQLARTIAAAAPPPALAPLVVDLSEVVLAPTPVLQWLLQRLVSIAGGTGPVVVCRRLSARRVVRRAAGRAPVAVVARIDEALGAFHQGNGGRS